MIALSVAIICTAGLIAQYRAQEHDRDMQAERSLLYKVESRVSELERRKGQEFDKAAFEELKSKVEGLRFAQGLKGAR